MKASQALQVKECRKDSSSGVTVVSDHCCKAIVALEKVFSGDVEVCTFHHQVLPAYHNRFEVSIAGGINLFLKVISFTEELFDSVNPKKRNTHCCMST